MKVRLFLTMLFIGVNLFGKSTKNLKLSYDINDFQFHQGAEGLSITSNKYNIYYRGNTNEPALPYMNVNVLVSPDACFDGSIYNKHEIPVMADIDISSNPEIFPMQTPLPQKMTDAILTYPLNVYPLTQVEYQGAAQMNGYKLLTFHICPFRYDNINKNLFLMSSCSIEIHLVEDNVGCKNLNELLRKSMASNIKDIVINGDELESLYPDDRSKSYNIEYDYLLITRDSLKNAFRPLADWKTQKGIRSKILTVEEIDSIYSARNTPLRIKYAIRDYYQNHGTDYVLLGGDIDVVPGQMCKISWGIQAGPNPNPEPAYEDSVHSDLFYSCLETMDWDTNGDGIYGDLADSVNILPDLAVTRFPVGTYEQAQVVANRIVAYEKVLDLSLYKKNMLLCGKLILLYTDAAPIFGQRLLDNHISPYWNGSTYRFYDDISDFGAQYPFNNTNFRMVLENGYSFINVDAHGNAYSWVWEFNPPTIEYYSDYYASRFQNSCYSIIVTSACKTNAYDLQNYISLSEAFIRNPNSRILAYLGCSRNGFGSISSETSFSSNFNACFFDSLFNTPCKNFGSLVMHTKRCFYSMYYDRGEHAPTRWLLNGINPVGDPEMPIFTSIPLEISNVTYSKTENGIIIDSGLEGCRICVMSIADGGNAIYEVSDLTQSMTITIPNQDCSLCITKPGYKPYIAQIQTQQFIQNQTLSGNRIYTSSGITIGKDVTTSVSNGPVNIESGSIRIINRNGVTIKNCFEVNKGAEFEIR